MTENQKQIRALLFALFYFGMYAISRIVAHYHPTEFEYLVFIGLYLLIAK